MDGDGRSIRDGRHSLIVAGPAVVEWAARRTNDRGEWGLAVGIGQERDGTLEAAAVYNGWNGADLCIHLVVEGRLSRASVTECLWRYPFVQVGARRLSAYIAAANDRCRRLAVHAGFRWEATLKGAHRTGDLMIYVLTPDRAQRTVKRYAESVTTH